MGPHCDARRRTAGAQDRYREALPASGGARKSRGRPAAHVARSQGPGRYAQGARCVVSAGSQKGERAPLLRVHPLPARLASHRPMASRRRGGDPPLAAATPGTGAPLVVVVEEEEEDRAARMCARGLMGLPYK